MCGPATLPWSEEKGSPSEPNVDTLVIPVFALEDRCGKTVVVLIRQARHKRPLP